MLLVTAATVMPTPVVTGIDYINAAGTKITATYPASARQFIDNIVAACGCFLRDEVA